MTIQQYPIDKYAKALCEAVEAYNGSDGYPRVTYDFENEPAYPIMRSPGKKKWQFEYNFRGGFEVPHPDMSGVERLIRCQLRSSNWQEVKQGLLNVVYWGFSGDQKSLRSSRVGEFYERVTKAQICEFMKKVNDSSEPALVWIEKLKMPIFSRMSFVIPFHSDYDVNSGDKLSCRHSRESGNPLI